MGARRFLSTVSWLALLALLAAPVTSGSTGSRLPSVERGGSKQIEKNGYSWFDNR